jgi:lipase maturation factor
VSLAVQITGLVGSRGILPIGQLLAVVRKQYGTEAYRLLPTLLWLGSSDGVLTFLCWAGAALALIAIAGRGGTLVFVLLWALYLSLTVAGQVFLEFQWDALLLETGLLACLYAPLRSSHAAEPNPIVRWVLWSLAYKLTFLSGITKILSGDPSWAAWTALTYHYETQPIPAWTSWYAHQLPAAFHYWSVPAMLAIELAAPFAVFFPVRFWWTRLVACAAMILLQLSIAATGNYGFFNLLAIVLYLALLDDETLRLRPSGRVADKNVSRGLVAWRVATSTIAIGIAVVSTVTFVQEMERTAGTPVQLEGAWADRVVRWLSPFRSINGYGLFRVMTTARPEIVIEVSEDGQQWREYEFRWKPGDLQRRPAFVEPHMPRLDWQMWFAALDPGGAQYWLDALVQRILSGEPVVRRLLGPSPLSSPPRFVRLAYYRYRFTTPAERAKTGAWWVRTFEGYLTGPIEAQ